jgi:hypothetical protein
MAYHSYAGEEILQANLQTCAKGPQPLSLELMGKVHTMVKYNMAWECEDIITYTDSGEAFASSMMIPIRGTRYTLEVQPPIIEGTFCKVRSQYVNGDQKSRRIFDVCKTPSDFFELLLNAHTRLEKWEKETVPFLCCWGFAVANPGQRYWLFKEEGFKLKVLPSLFPGAETVLLRDWIPSTGNKGPSAPDWEAKDLEMLYNMVGLLTCVEPTVEEFPMGWSVREHFGA